MDNSISQSEELIALQSIYEEQDLIVEHDKPPSGRFVAKVKLPQPFFIHCENDCKSQQSRSGSADCNEVQNRKLQVDHLPPLNLFFEFPQNYPSDSCPAFLLSCNWLNVGQLSELCKKLESIWKSSDGEVVLFQWISFLQDETLEFLGLTDCLDITKLSKYKLNNYRSNVRLNKRNSPLSKFERCPEVSCHQQPQTNCSPIKSPALNNDKRYYQTSVKPDPETLSKASLLGTNCDSESIGNFPQKEPYSCENECISTNKINGANGESTEVFQHKKFQTIVFDIKPSVSGGLGHQDNRAMLDLTNGASLFAILEEYDKKRKFDAFQNMWFVCKICLMDKKGQDFIKFRDCNHMYCRECLKTYFEIQIRDGNVHSLNCPDEKCHSQADGTQVKEIVCAELFLKYDTLLLSRTLEGMSDIAYCPRQTCQCALVTELGSTMGSCPACNFVFCLFCRMAYHGIAPCNFKSEEKRQLCTKYINSNGGEKAEMERRYGRRVLQLLVDNTLSEEWVHSNSKKCPHCRACIEKTEGCNKMTCFRCGTYFCWLCMSRLKPSNPYAHFNDSRSPCFEQLFPDFYDDDEEPGQFL